MVVLVVWILNGCLLHTQRSMKIESLTPYIVKKQPQKSNFSTMSKTSKIQNFDWLGSIQPLVNQMLEAQGVIIGSLLLLDDMHNNTNGALPTDKATDALYKSLKTNSIFGIIQEARLIHARQALGLSLRDTFYSRSKAIGLARIINAQYVLHSDLNGDVKSPMLDMQLILVQTGEIIWSGSGTIEPDN
ncbi:penicillin-binding protein activator LpoB [Candidatus Gillettellia adelgis]